MKVEVASQVFYEFNEVVYAPKYYYSKKVRQDEYSRNVVFSKKSDLSEYFFPDVIQLINEIKNAKGLWRDFELITIIPSHEPGKYSPTLESLGGKLSDYLEIPFEKIIERIKSSDSKESDCNRPKERYDLVKDSMRINSDLNGISCLLILDDVKVTGMSLLEAKKLLMECGISDTLSICLGINVSRGSK
jgi:predicted amidophosphoribosyltransferase